ncbi:MAG: U32 family peptidase, partial [Methanosarcinales archaeon]|nr:U32 family peptidase [Methanosarcinales archaeon]
SMVTAVNVIEAGADEIYLGLETPGLVNLNLSGRGRSCNVKDQAELADIVTYAHERGVLVDYTVNAPFMADSMEEMYVDHVMRGVDAGVDALIVGEFGALALLHELDLGLPIHASVLLNNFNRGQIEMLANLGVDKVVLPFKITMDEISQLSGLGVELEVFGQFGCSNINGTCHLIHNADEAISLGLPCRANYRVSEDGRLHNILDAGTDCSLCSMGQLMDAGVSALKVVGRCMNPEMIRTIIQTYRSGIDMVQDGATPAEVKAWVLEEIPFWLMMCDQHRCKYLKTPINDSYV